MNNQKAVLKVGTDSFFVTNVSGGTTSNTTNNTTGNSTTLPTITLTPFFSGISLDVTPQVDDGTNVTLHIHPAVTSVTEVSKQIDLGAIGNYKLPLASSAVNETDTLVRIQDGRIVAIGGLMQMDSSRNVSGVPGTTGSPFAPLFGNKATQGRKREVIVLIKPTIIRTASDWDDQNRRARAALDDMDDTRARVIQLDGNIVK
jgi:MSHA biogenesis protein MshL